MTMAARRVLYRVLKYVVAFSSTILVVLNVANILLTSEISKATKPMKLTANNLIDTTTRYRSAEELYTWVNEPEFNVKMLGGDVKIYVYSLPEIFNIKQLEINAKHPPNLWDPNCKTNFYSLERSFHNYLIESPYFTSDPRQAHFFYVPTYSSCFLINNQPNNLTKTGEFHKELFNHIVTTYSFFNLSQGRDHVWMFSQGLGARMFGNWRSIKSGIFLVHNGQFTLDEFTPLKDIPVPPDLTGYNFPSYFELPVQKRPKKKWLVHFGGTVIPANIKDARGEFYSRGVRQYIKKHFSSDHEFRITGTRVSTYVRDMMSSVFCLCPEGWHAWNPRPYQAVLLGCIPVLLSEEIELAFEDVLDYSKFMVRIRPSNIRILKRILKSIPVHEVKAMQEELTKVWRFFSYGKNGLAKYMIVRALDRRRTVNHIRRKFRNLHSFSSYA